MSQTANFSHPILCSAWSPNGRIVAFAGSSQKIGVFTKIIEVISTKHGRSKLQVDPREANLMGKLGGQTNLRGKLMNPFTRGKA